ncbi:hypothetical protein CJJ07_005536 [Candidozyma auris]|nr:hypothetical protein CJJ07_005536 [[Candida] auris]
MFVSSKTVYKDLVQCMTAKELKKIDVSIQRMFQGIGADKLYARPKKGGFGVIELKVQLQGHRAKVLARTLGDDQSWYVKYMRAKMLHHVVKIFRSAIGHNAYGFTNLHRICGCQTLCSSKTPLTKIIKTQCCQDA